jgi:hypothetical protein
MFRAMSRINPHPNASRKNRPFLSSFERGRDSFVSLTAYLRYQVGQARESVPPDHSSMRVFGA